METANVGKPLGESRGEVGMVAEVLHFYAGAVDKHRGATVPVAGGVDMTFHEPLGVVGAIVPWNFPIAITSWKVGPALATGNTIVVKPAETTPLTALRLAELALDAGIPEGVLQVVTRQRARWSAPAWSSTPRWPRSPSPARPRSGRQVMATAARYHQAGHPGARRQVGLDRVRRRRPRAGGGRRRRPGSSPMPARIAVHGAACWSKRTVLRRVRRLPRPCESAGMEGRATRPIRRYSMGPLVTAAHRARGGRSFLGSGWASRPAVRCPRGRSARFRTAPASGSRRPWSHRPMPEWRLAREEIFGPIVAVIPFDDEDDAVRLANDTPYGLSGSIWTRDGAARSLRMARAVQAGNLSVNSNSSVRVQTSFGGMKQSGFGRELGLEALAAYSDVKNVFVSTEG